MQINEFTTTRFTVVILRIIKVQVLFLVLRKKSEASPVLHFYISGEVKVCK